MYFVSVNAVKKGDLRAANGNRKQGIYRSRASNEIAAYQQTKYFTRKLMGPPRGGCRDYRF
jgi:hypothetical protein